MKSFMIMMLQTRNAASWVYTSVGCNLAVPKTSYSKHAGANAEITISAVTITINTAGQQRKFEIPGYRPLSTNKTKIFRKKLRFEPRH